MATPKPTPTRLKILKGNPGRRPLPTNEPKPEIALKIPKPPSHLNYYAKKEWMSISKKLHGLGLLTEIDETALALYCQAYGRWVDAEIYANIFGSIFVTTKGNIIHSPYVGIANVAMRDCYKYLTEFGMTPSSRTKVTSANSNKKGKFTGLIYGNKK